MFDATALRGFVNQLQVDTSKLNAAQSKALLVRVATAERDRVIGDARARSGFPPAYRQVVDGREGASLETVRPDGTILFAWQYLAEIVDDTYNALVNRSPRDKGQYVAGLITLLDGVEAPLSTVSADTREIRIVASVPYARRLEIGRRRGGGAFVLQVAPHIVEETAIVARKLFGTLASVTFGYSDLTGAYALRTSSSHRRHRGRLVTDVRYPTITITPRTA